MLDVKYSALLNDLIEASKIGANGENVPLTAEKFLLSVFEYVEKNSESGVNNHEFAEAKDIVEGAFFDSEAAKYMLSEYTSDKNSFDFLADLHMKKVIDAAKKSAIRLSKAEVQVSDVLLSILAEPTDTIVKAKSALGVEKKQATTGTDVKKDSNEHTSGYNSVFNSINRSLDEKKGITHDEDVKQRQPHIETDKPLDMNEIINEVNTIRDRLSAKVFGQENAINVFANGYFQSRMLPFTDKNRKRPLATFLFAGPPGVGKTFLAEQVAEALERPFMRFDMSEYSDKEAVVEFAGSDDVYKNSKAGNVTSFVAENPNSVLLFDEIEKAHISIIYLFLQMLDAGRLRDSKYDKEISFKDTIIILTTNAGKQLYEDSELDDLSGVSRKVIIKALEKDVDPRTGVPFFPSAMCSRFASGNVVMFNHITASKLRVIAKNEILKHASSFEKASGIKVSFDDDVFVAMLLSEGASADARTVRSRAENFFNTELFEFMRLLRKEKECNSMRDIKEIHFTVDVSKASDDIQKLFKPNFTPKVLVFANDDYIEYCKQNINSCEVFGAGDIATATEIIKNREIDFVLLDVKYGINDDNISLNVEDVSGISRDFYKFLRTQKVQLPIYLLDKKDASISREEVISYIRRGVRGVVAMGNDDAFDSIVNNICIDLYQQTSLSKLSRENKLVSYETSQFLVENGEKAQIKMFDLRLETAVESEDGKHVLSGISRPEIKFDEVIGATEAKKELTYFVEYLKNPKKYMGTGVKAPRGVLLYGPPGTGKTMLAKAMASESNVTFIAAEGNQFLKKYVGEGPEAVHDLFKTARKYAPSILFIDEIDAIAKERRGSDSSGTAAVEETLTSFLTEMDGFVTDPTKPVFVLAATNFDVEPGRPKSLDPALMRRFDRRVYIELPSKDDRIKFLNMKISNHKALDISAAQVENLAMRSTGMSLAQLDSVIELALRSAIRDGSIKVTDSILEEAFETFNNGEAKKWDVSQLERVARHEAGHAFLCWHSGETPSYLTVVARGNHGGYMQHADNEGKAIYTKDELLAKIRTSLGGRAAEIVYYGDKDGISTGASGDLANATSMAYQMVCTYGMDAEFGMATVNPNAVYENEKARNVVNSLLSKQLDEAVCIISQNKHKIDALADELMVKNHLNGKEIDELLSDK